MTPYYQDELATIWLGDAREILPGIADSLRPFAIVSDPPYGMNYQHGGGGRGAARDGFRHSEPIIGDDTPFDPSWMLALEADGLLLWGAQHYRLRLPATGTLIAWDKSLGIGPADHFHDVDFCWTTQETKRNSIRFLWKGLHCWKTGENAGRRYHPSQKPIYVMARCLRLFPEQWTAVDPYMGSGSTLVAAKKLGRRCVGVEIVEKYAEIAAERLRQRTIAFDPEPLPAGQLTFGEEGR